MRFVVVDPQNDPRLIPWIQNQYIGDTTRHPYNFMSMLELGVRLDDLIPNEQLMAALRESEYGDGENVELFDNMYVQYILSNDKPFIALMNLCSDFLKEDDVILISNYNNRVTMPILDCLLKLIQERYGVMAFLVNTIDDIEDLNMKSSSFGDLDKQIVFSDDTIRFCRLTKQPLSDITNEEIVEDARSLMESAMPGAY